jgi:hypothetical protein
MSLADDLRATAVDQVTVVLQRMLSTGRVQPELLAQAAVEVAGPLLLDAERVEDALAARVPVDQSRQRARIMLGRLWEQAGGDEARYLDLMCLHGWLELSTIRLAGGSS